jgi:uncharacterized protein
MIDRRHFLRLSTGAALGLSVSEALAREASASPGSRIVRYVRLGHTDLKVSDISFGSASSADPALVTHAFERGVNYFDTAESYKWGNAEEAIGQALRGKRLEVVLSTKTKAGSSDTSAEMMKALEGSLRRLKTDHVDIYFNHAVNDVERMRNPQWREFTELAKRQGKIRFRGMSGHGSHLAECLDYAIDNDLVDVILVAHSFGQDPSFYDKLRHTFHWAAIQPDLPRVLAKAKQKDIGVVAMKTLMGGRLNDMRPYERPGGTFAQAAFRWVLSNPNVDGLIISMTSTELIDEYVAASGERKVSDGDRDLLERYVALQSGKYCHPGCNACEQSCPMRVPIAEVLRTRMYDVDYGDPLLARAEYAALGESAAACLTCAHRSCLCACPHAIPIAELTRDAARRLG